MQRFNDVKINKEIYRVVDYIFDCVKKAEPSGWGGFRQDGYFNIYSRFFTFVFLCGGNKNEYTSRDLLQNILNNNKDVKIIISEDLAKYKGDMDLLTFEATLEAISKMILIPVESFGTACELGAFTRINSETNKVVAILDKKRASENSFINYGPISLLKDINLNRVLYASYSHKGNKHILRTNSDINKLDQHDLVISETKIKKYFDIDSNQVMITDLRSFFIAVLDLICLVGFVNIEMVLYYFCKRFGCDEFIIKTDTIGNGNYDLVKNILYTFLKVLESIGFLVNKKDVYFVQPHQIVKDFNKDEKWIGQVLFTKKFTYSDEYVSIKAEAVKVLEKLKKYADF